MIRCFSQYNPETRSMPARGGARKRTKKTSRNVQPKQKQKKEQSIKTSVINYDKIPRINGTFIVNVNRSVIKDIAYDNVFINGNPIITNAHDVEFKTFMNNLILGVHYTNNANKRQWHLYNADAKTIAPDLNCTIQHVSCTDDTLYVYTDSRAIISLSKYSIMEKIFKPTRFVIKNCKTR